MKSPKKDKPRLSRLTLRCLNLKRSRMAVLKKQQARRGLRKLKNQLKIWSKTLKTTCH